MKSIFVIIVTTFFGHYINAQVVPFAFIKSPANNITSVVIGNQVWTDKNLDVTTYSDGTTISQTTNTTAWANATTGAWCYFNNDPANGAIYGKLYNWYALAGIFDEASKTDVTKRKKLAPTGWHIPSDEEWTTLGTLLGGDAAAGGKMKTTGITRWTTPNTSATNESGYAALPGGTRSSNGAFFNVGYAGLWWSATESNSTNAWSRYLYYDGGYLYRSFYNKKVGFSVRCLRD